MDDARLRRLLDEQAGYYRARASTYDLDMRWGSDDPELRALFRPVDEWFADLPVQGDVLELACGTGAWTRRLAARADHVHALDIAPEMIDRARSRVGDSGPGLGRVTFEVADVVRWAPPRRYDVVFFSYLLSHVPTVLVPPFWEVVESALVEDGVVAFVDAAPTGREHEEWVGDDVALRRLRDGSVHRIVKVFPTPTDVRGAMAGAELDGAVAVVNEAFMVGSGTRIGGG